MSTELTPAMRRSMLIAALRDRKLWPEGFAWDFNSCANCAMGFLLKFSGVKFNYLDHEDNVCELLGITHGQLLSIFRYAERNYGCDYHEVTPEMVASRLEKFHAGQELEMFSGIANV